MDPGRNRAESRSGCRVARRVWCAATPGMDEVGRRSGRAGCRQDVVVVGVACLLPFFAKVTVGRPGTGTGTRTQKKFSQVQLPNAPGLIGRNRTTGVGRAHSSDVRCNFGVRWYRSGRALPGVGGHRYSNLLHDLACGTPTRSSSSLVNQARSSQAPSTSIPDCR